MSAMRNGSVYVVGCAGTPYVKIGFSASGAAARVKNLQIGCPFELFLWGEWEGLSHWDEIALHELLAPHRVRGEWFDVSGEVGLAIDEALRAGSISALLDAVLEAA